MIDRPGVLRVPEVPGTDIRPDLEYPYLRSGGRTDADVTVVTALHGNDNSRANAAA